MKKFLTILFIVMFFNFQVSAQWTERSWLGWYDQIWGASSNYASFTFTEHQTGFKIAGGAGPTPSSGIWTYMDVTHDYGFTWENPPISLPISSLGSVVEINSKNDTVFVVMDDYYYGITLFSSNDNGVTWDYNQIYYGRYIDFYTKNLKTIYCLYEDYYSNQYTLLRIVNDDTLTLSTELEGFKEICFPDTVTGYARSSFSSGGYLEKTIDGGRSWTSILNTGSLDRINFPSQNTGYLSKGRTLYRTLNGGNSVDTLSTPNLGTINYINCFNDSTIYCACNSGQLIYSFDYGNTWILEVVTSSNVNLQKVVVLEEGIVYVCDSDQYLHANDGLVESVKDVDKFLLNIYPNPASSKVYIPKTAKKIDYILLLNSHGQQIHTFQGDQQIIHIEELPKGMYILVAVSKEKKYYSKFVKI